MCDEETWQHENPESKAIQNSLRCLFYYSINLLMRGSGICWRILVTLQYPKLIYFYKVCYLGFRNFNIKIL